MLRLHQYILTNHQSLESSLSHLIFHVAPPSNNARLLSFHVSKFVTAVIIAEEVCPRSLFKLYKIGFIIGWHETQELLRLKNE